MATQKVLAEIVSEVTETLSITQAQRSANLLAIAEEILDSIAYEGKNFGFSIETVLAKVMEIAEEE